MASIVWFNQDRRLQDNPALAAAVDRKRTVIPLYIWDPQSEGEWIPGSNSCWWIHHSLENLKHSLAEIGLPLIIREGNSLDCLRQIIKETNYPKPIVDHTTARQQALLAFQNLKE